MLAEQQTVHYSVMREAVTAIVSNHHWCHFTHALKRMLWD